MLVRRGKSEVHSALRERYPFDYFRTSNLEPEGMRSSTSPHESWENGNSKTWALSAQEDHTSPKNDGDAVEHLQQAELENWHGRRSSGKQPDKMETEFASAVKQTCSFILSKFPWSAVAETDNDISSDRHSMKEEFQQFCRRILQLLCRGN